MENERWCDGVNVGSWVDIDIDTILADHCIGFILHRQYPPKWQY